MCTRTLSTVYFIRVPKYCVLYFKILSCICVRDISLDRPQVNNELLESSADDSAQVDEGLQRFKNDEAMIERINRKQNSWTATVYPEWEQYTVRIVLIFIFMQAAFSVLIS